VRNCLTKRYNSVPSIINGLHGVSAAPRHMDGTWTAHGRRMDGCAAAMCAGRTRRRTRVRAYESRGFVLAAAAGPSRIKFLHEPGRVRAEPRTSVADRQRGAAHKKARPRMHPRERAEESLMRNRSPGQVAPSNGRQMLDAARRSNKRKPLCPRSRSRSVEPIGLPRGGAQISRVPEIKKSLTRAAG
jgi:hypothetical protein